MADLDQNDLAQAAKRYWAEDGNSDGGVIREVDYAAFSGGLAPELEGIKIVDCDTHFTEPADLFTSRAPIGMKDKMPRITRIDGVDHWYVGDRDFGIVGGNVIRNDNNKLLGRFAFKTLEEGTPGAYDMKTRLQAMDDMGIHAQICFHNSGVTQAGSLMSLEPELAFTIMRLYNDAAAERQVDSDQRLFTLGHLPYWDKKQLETEGRRCYDIGLKGFVMPDKPEMFGVPSYMEPYWTDFFEMCEETGMPLNFHLNAAVDPNAFIWQGFQFEQSLSIVSTMYAVGNAATLGNWIVSGLLDRHPKLKIGLIECGMGWVPFVLEALDHQFNEMLPSLHHKFQRRPWEYFADQFWTTFWFEKVGPKLLLETLGVDKVLFETDYPHPTSLYPGVQEHLVDVLGGYDYEVRKKVLQSNATTLYNLPF